MVGIAYKSAMENTPVILTLKIDNSQPIALTAFVKSFTSLVEEYRLAVKSDENFTDDNAEIYIKQIRSGSIIADLIPMAGAALPIIAAEADKIYLAIEFVKKWESRVKMLVSGIIPEGASKGDLKRWNESVEAIARDPNASSTLEAATFEDGKREVKATFTFKSSEARQIEDVIEGEFQRLEDKSSADYERVLMIFTRSDVGDVPVGKRDGGRVMISDISEKPLAITYGSEIAEQRIKHEIRESDGNIYKKGFNVDVKVQYSATHPVAYSILHVHGVIDLPDEE